MELSKTRLIHKAQSVYTTIMTTIYVRIPRNRWTPIGQIDLFGWERANHDWKTSINLKREIEKRMEITTALTLKIRDYEKEHDLTTPHDRTLTKNRHHVKVLDQLERQRWEQSPAKYLIEEAKKK